MTTAYRPSNSLSYTATALIPLPVQAPCPRFRADAPSASRRRAAFGPVRQRTAGFLMRARRSGSVFDGGGDPIAATVIPGGGIGGPGTLALCDGEMHDEARRRIPASHEGQGGHAP